MVSSLANKVKTALFVIECEDASVLSYKHFDCFVDLIAVVTEHVLVFQFVIFEMASFAYELSCSSCWFLYLSLLNVSFFLEFLISLFKIKGAIENIKIIWVNLQLGNECVLGGYVGGWLIDGVLLFVGESELALIFLLLFEEFVLVFNLINWEIVLGVLLTFSICDTDGVSSPIFHKILAPHRGKWRSPAFMLKSLAMMMFFFSHMMMWMVMRRWRRYRKVPRRLESNRNFLEHRCLGCSYLLFSGFFFVFKIVFFCFCGLMSVSKAFSFLSVNLLFGNISLDELVKSCDFLISSDDILHLIIFLLIF